MQLLVALIRKVRQVDELRVIRIIRHSFGPRVAAAVLALERGATIIRVHDVAETVDALGVFNALTRR